MKNNSKIYLYELTIDEPFILYEVCDKLYTHNEFNRKFSFNCLLEEITYSQRDMTFVSIDKYNFIEHRNKIIRDFCINSIFNHPIKYYNKSANLFLLVKNKGKEINIGRIISFFEGRNEDKESEEVLERYLKLGIFI